MHISLQHKSQIISWEEVSEKATRNSFQVEGLARAKVYLLFTHIDSFPSTFAYIFIFISIMDTHSLHQILNTLLFCIVSARFFLGNNYEFYDRKLDLLISSTHNPQNQV